MPLKLLEERQLNAFDETLRDSAISNDLLIVLQESIRSVRQLQDLLAKKN